MLCPGLAIDTPAIRHHLPSKRDAMKDISLERSSEHPLAAAVVAAAKQRGLAMEDVADFTSVTGKGVTGTIGGQQVAVGNAKLFRASLALPTSRPKCCLSKRMQSSAA
jgi:cation transport ATPase